MGNRLDLVVRGGTVVNSQGQAPLDVYVKDGRIAAVEPPGRQHDANDTIDASGLFVLPGMVDTHVHLMDPGDDARESFPDGTAAAACNGVTTIIEHTHGWPVTSVDLLAEKRAHLRGRSHVDYGLAAHVWPDKIDGLAELWRAGVTFFKVFTCTTHGVPAIRADLIFDVLGAVAGFDGACLIHCEDDLMTERNERVLRASGRIDPGVIYEWRSREAEVVAVGTVALASRLTGARVTIAHVSNPSVLEVLGAEQRLGSPAKAETCPQYLILREDEILSQGALRKFTPPARIRSDEEEDEMWAAFNSGAVHHLSSDHAPSTLEQKCHGSIWDAPFGLPGLDSTLRLMLDAALTGRTSLERLVEAYAEAPARQYGLARKGRISVGMDADMVLVKPDPVSVISNERVLSKAGWSPFADRKSQGQVLITMLRGSVISIAGSPNGDRTGQFIPGPGTR